MDNVPLVRLHIEIQCRGQFSEEVLVKSGVPQAYVNGIWKNIESTLRFVADGCVTYRIFLNNENKGTLQKDLDRLREWAVENTMKINPSICKAVHFTRARIKDPLNYSLMYALIPEASSYKYLALI